MGRKTEQQGLEVKIPTFFRCPISLDMMKSPVSLCTGVTYDRSSIQRWLESGNTTCPATMQPLPSTDLVPNLTLQRLIHLWSASQNTLTTATPTPTPIDLLRRVRSAQDPIPPLRCLSDFFSDADVDEFAKNNLISKGGCASALMSIIAKGGLTLETQEAVVGILAVILTADCIEEDNKQLLASTLASSLDRSVSTMVDILKKGIRLDSRIDAARVLDAMMSSISDSEKTRIAGKHDLLPELIRLIGPCDDKDGKVDRQAIEAGLGCLVRFSGLRRTRVQMVRFGIVPALARVLAEEATVVPAAAAEWALRMMDAVSGCAEGREAICADADRCLGAVLGRVMKVGREGTEAAVGVLWSVCHLFRDRRAQEAVSAAGGGINKFLLLMQSDCSPAARQMARDLLKIFRVNSKSCLSGYDTKTTHIMPF